MNLKLIKLEPPAQRMLCVELMIKSGYSGNARDLAYEAESLRTYLVNGPIDTTLAKT